MKTQKLYAKFIARRYAVFPIKAWEWLFDVSKDKRLTVVNCKSLFFWRARREYLAVILALYKSTT